MNTEEIRCTLEADSNTAPLFLGVFSADQLPNIEYRPSAFVANTDPSTSPGEHWVAFFIDKETEYFDSYGLPPFPVFENYLSRLGKYIFNDVTLQDFDTTVCGQYCIFFLHYRCQGYTMDQIVGFLQKLPNKNDVIVRDFVKYSPIFSECQTCQKRSKL